MQKDHDQSIRPSSSANNVSPFAAYRKNLEGERADVTVSCNRVLCNPARLTAAALAAVASPRSTPASPHSNPHAASRFPFRSLCTLFESVLTSVNKAQQYAQLEAFWRLLPRDESFFPFMRLLLPHLDNARPLYHLRENKLARLYVDTLGLHHRSGEAQRLMQWKDPSKSSVDTTCFSDVVYVMLQRKGGFQRPDLVSVPEAADSAGVMSAFTVESMNAFLDRLAAAATNEARQRLLMESLLRTTPLEQKWFVRIVLKDMKFRMTHQTLLSAFHPTALDKFNRTNDLAYVCEACLEEINNPAPGSSAAGVFLFLPLRPMLASPVTAKKLEQMLTSSNVLLEPKYDGERIMVHIDAQDIMYWTRNAKNFSSLYGPKLDDTLRSSFIVGSQVTIAHVKNLNSAQSVDEDGTGRTTAAPSEPASKEAQVTLDNAIFDGELLLYDASTQGYIPFGSNRTFATGGDGALAGTGDSSGVPIDGSQRWFCYMVFDVVFLNGKSLMHLPLSARRHILHCIVHQQKNRIEVVPSCRVANTQDILTELQKKLDANLEGVVLKVSDSPYVPAERKTKWVKLKPDHIAGLSDTVDLVVVGGYHGTKFGSRHISHFLMATWVNSSSRTPRDPEAMFNTVCKIGNGFTSEELGSIQAALDPHWTSMPARRTVPSWLNGWKPASSDLVPDVYVHPTQSVVLEVYGYAFVPSANYGVKYTIRFPRMLRIRFDKSLEDATDLQTLGKIKDASTDALRRRASQSDGRDDELLTVMSMKWKRRREERRGHFGPGTGNADGDESMGNDPQAHRAGTSTHPVVSTMPASLRGGHVLRWVGAEPGLCTEGDGVPGSLPPRTIAYVPRSLGVTRLSAQEAVLDDLFAGYEFCILFTSEETCSVNPALTGSRTSLEKCLLQHGGQVVANPGRQTSLLLASSSAVPKVTNWVDFCRAHPETVEKKYAASDVVHCDWAMACVEAGTVLPLAPRFVLYASPSLADKFKLLLDPFEDSYYEPATLESILYSMEQAKKKRVMRTEGSHATVVRGDVLTAMVEASNTNYRLREELGVLKSDALRLSAVCVSSPATSPEASPEHRPSLAEDGATRVTDSVAERILGDRQPRVAVPQAKDGCPFSSGAAPLEADGGRDSLGAVEEHVALDGHGSFLASSKPSKEVTPDTNRATVPLASCRPIPSPAEWTVSQFIAMVRLMKARDCHIAVEPCDFFTVTCVVDQYGTLLRIDNRTC